MRKFLTLCIGFILTMSISAANAADITSVSYREKSDERYVFRVKDSNQRFLLLDVTDDSAGKFFLMGIDYYGQTAFDDLGNQKFDATASSNVAYKLNHTLIDDGLQHSFTKKKYKLPKNVISHIDFEHVWDTEGSGKSGSDAENNYKTKCGVAILSQSEFLKYQSKIGWKDELTMYSNTTSTTPIWWLRTGRFNGEVLILANDVPTSTRSWGVSDGTPMVRPVFYVDSKFFADVPIDLETAGEEVTKLFKEYYTAGEMEKIYSKRELADYLDYRLGVDVDVTSFSNGSQRIERLNGNTSFTAAAEVTNNTSSAASGTLVMAYYDSYGKSMRISSEAMLLSPGESRNVELSLDLEAMPERGSYVKLSFIPRGVITSQTGNSIRYFCE